jgi:hypothetical protein
MAVSGRTGKAFSGRTGPKSGQRGVSGRAGSDAARLVSRPGGEKRAAAPESGPSRASDHMFE